MIELKHSCIGARCSVCGKNIIEYINGFQFASGTTVICKDCGATLFTVNKGKTGNLTLNCFACGEKHTYTLSKKAFFSGAACSFGCKENKIDVLFVGCYEDVDDALFRLSMHMKSLTEKYYENLEKNYGFYTASALKILEDKARNKRIFCLCGNYQLNIKIVENAIHLICPNCGSSEIISISNDEDIKNLFERRSIFIK